ncbi:phospholipase A2 [Streptomyces cacaoi]|uniref:phospholipase A2 n=1 Tax=Streptomyces cacaoi TaxID=1898 RepID=UPI00374A7F53
MRTSLPTTAAALVLTAAGTLGSAGTAVAASAPGTAAPADPAVRTAADRIMNLTYQEFATTEHVAPFNWTNDGCSVPLKFTPYKEVFRPACNLHDFGYRNYGGGHELKLSPVRETKNWIDGRFLTEMKRICDDRYPLPVGHTACQVAARAYYEAVNKTPTADKAFFGHY